MNYVFQPDSKKDSRNTNLIVIFYRVFCYLTPHVTYSMYRTGFDFLVKRPVQTDSDEGMYPSLTGDQ